MKNLWFVSRQKYWPEGTCVVEIAYGGLDYANPDMLVPRWSELGEGEEFADPRLAVEAAIAICRQWRKATDEHVSIAHGYTAGFTCSFEPGTFKEAVAWAKQVWEGLEKCDHCGDPLPDEPWQNESSAWSGEKFCSESCATAAQDFDNEQNELADEIVLEQEDEQ